MPVELSFAPKRSLTQIMQLPTLNGYNVDNDCNLTTNYSLQDGLTSNELKVAKLRKWPLIDYSHETSGLELTVNALWRKKERLETDLEWYKEKEANVMACIDRYGFIYASYQPHAWYWEVVELVRKFMLVSLVIFVEPGTATQLAFAFMIAFAFLVAHVYSKACVIRVGLGISIQRLSR